MTREQALKMAKAKLECIERRTSGKTELCREDCESCSLCYEQGNMGDQMKWLKMSVKALEQEPCEDCISRKVVLDTLGKMDSVLDEDRTVETYKELLIACYNDLPPVTPTRKKGKWINKSHTSGCGITFVASECTCCGKKTFFDCDQLVYNYCPNCGAEMEGEVEG